MSEEQIPEVLRHWSEHNEECDAKLAALMPLYAAAVDCRRCLLFLRDPDLRRSRLTHWWWDDDRHALARDPQWAEEGNLAADDPMYGEAMVNPEALYVEDVDNAPPGLLDPEFEREHFGHRALIHAPIYDRKRFLGVLEPCVFDRPRRWSGSDRAITAWAQEQVGPLAAAYLARYGPGR